jgi:NDP-sugar pyrophosphorylase family protein
LKAIILCAGYGKRLYPYTKDYQKTMVPVYNKPLLEYIINGLIYAGTKDFILVVGYRKEQIMNYFDDGTKWKIKISYVEQSVLNGTGGALLLCESLIKNSHFMLSWGDILLDYSIYKTIIDLYHKEQQNFILTANYTKDPHLGAAIYTKNSYLENIIEKPAIGTSESNLNNAGVFILSKQIFDTLKLVKPSQRGEIELSDALLIGVKKKNWKVRVLEMDKNQFRGDFGNRKEFERLKKDKSWLQFLNFK